MRSRGPPFRDPRKNIPDEEETQCGSWGVGGVGCSELGLFKERKRPVWLEGRRHRGKLGQGG